MKTNSDSENSAIFSLRIVSIDNYMKAPLFGLDTCYSEFRAEEVKQVPVIRIFGTDSNGIKTCAHVHGVFPYLYVPYAGGDAAGESDRLAYQLASSLDKAINISLGQTNSNTQHVFKIILVKAKPFYGYHKTEHKFLKIFLYNPVFIRRAANLLQNGVILGRVFQPHESHVPYILQFMIDYNLYGMSFIYIPNKLVRYRQQARTPNCEFGINGDIEWNDESLRSVDPNQILDEKIERMSTSKQEIDFSAAVILNRFQISMTDEDNEHANPGIAFLWSDERGRRNKMDGTPPPMVPIPEASQDRDILTTVESELFHQAALNRRLEQFRAESLSTPLSYSSLEQTLNRSSANRKIDLNQLLQNSVYPAEWTSNDASQLNNKSILDASFLVDHSKTMKTTAAHSTETQASATYNQQWDNVQFDPNETFVDEELILSLTQKLSNQTLLNETLNENENEVLDIFELMEQDETHDVTLRIDDDSVLAPLSQKVSTLFCQAKNQNEKNDHIKSFEEEDSDDDLLNEFSMSILDCLVVEQQRTEMKIPQLDGAFDSPKKQQSAFKKEAIKSNTRSPSRCAKKYTPLDIVISKTPKSQNDSHATLKGLLMPTLCLERCDSPASELSKTYTISELVAESKAQSQARRALMCQNTSNGQKTLIQQQPQSSQQKQLQPQEKLLQDKYEKYSQQKEQIQSQPQQNHSPPFSEVPEKYRNILNKSPVVKLIRYDNIEESFKGKVSTTSSPTSSPTSSSHLNMQSNDEETVNDTKQDRDTIKRKQSTTDEDDEIVETTPETPLHRRYPKREPKPRQDLIKISSLLSSSNKTKSKRSRKRTKSDLDELNKMDFWYSWYKWSDCKLSIRYDEERQFIPQPGPSNLNYYEDDKIPGYYRSPKKATPSSTSNGKAKQLTPKSNGMKRLRTMTTTSLPQKHLLRKTKIQKLYDHSKRTDSPNGSVLSPLSAHSDWENDIHVQSFYDQSTMQYSPPTQKLIDDIVSPISNDVTHDNTETLANTTISTPAMLKLIENFKNSSSELEIRPISKIRTDTCTIKPANSIPCPREISNSNHIPKVIYKVPFYSDPSDVKAHNSKKEIGNTVLQLNGCAVNDFEEFKTEQNVVGMNRWQRLIGFNNMRSSRSHRDIKALTDEHSMRQFLAQDKSVHMMTNNRPPSNDDVNKWLNTRNHVNNKKQTLDSITIIDLDDDNSNNENLKKIGKDKTSKLDETEKNVAELSPKTQNAANIIQNLRSRKDITVSVVPKRNQRTILKSQSDDKNIDDDDDVVCMDDVARATSSIKQYNRNSLVRVAQ